MRVHPLANTMLERSPEFTTILECGMQLKTALSLDPGSIATLLLAKGFISVGVESEMRNTTYINSHKANILVEAVRNKIKLNKNKFKEFLDILQKLRWTKDIEKILLEKYKELCETAGETCTIYTTSTVAKKDSTMTYILLIAILIVFAFAPILFSQSTLVTVITEMITIPSLFAVGDSIVRDRSPLWALQEAWAMVFVILGNTLGSFIPFKCPYCKVWSRISSYGGNVVQGYAECPNCHRDIFNPRQQYNN